MNNKSLYALLLVITLILGFSFYWYSYRPGHIRSQCLAEAEFDQSGFKTPDDQERARIIDSYYKNCLHRFGLEK